MSGGIVCRADPWKAICAAFGYQCDLTAGRASLIPGLSPIVVTRNSSIESSVDRTAPWNALPVLCWLLSTPSECNVRLVASPAVQRAIASIDSVVNLNVTYVRDTRL